MCGEKKITEFNKLFEVMCVGRIVWERNHSLIKMYMYIINKTN